MADIYCRKVIDMFRPVGGEIPVISFLRILHSNNYMPTMDVFRRHHGFRPTREHKKRQLDEMDLPSTVAYSKWTTLQAELNRFPKMFYF